ncbi:MAG: baseplate J/gp47 family protein [Spirochaetales bacterium]|nr:baseplate J/gp47 family protein [Spirochaetales bacterium]
MSIPTASELRDQILTDFEAKVGQEVPLLAKSVFRIIATTVGGLLYLIYRYGAWIREQIFTSTMDSDALELRAAEYGMSRTAATKWIGTVDLTGTDDTVIASGTLFQYDGTVYQTTEAVTISGTTSVGMESLDTGDDVDRIEGDTLEIVTPQTGVDKEAAVTAVSQSGEDAEGDTSFRSRIMARQSRTPQGGAAADFVSWTREVSGVVKAFAFNTGSGEVTVYPLVGYGSDDRLPDESKLEEVKEYVGSNERCPLTASVSAAALTEVVFNITVTTLNPDSTLLREAIETSLENYLLGRYPKQYTDEADPTNIISIAEMHKEAFDAGTSFVALTVDIEGGSTGITGYTLGDNELAALGTITWPS